MDAAETFFFRTLDFSGQTPPALADAFEFARAADRVHAAVADQVDLDLAALACPSATSSYRREGHEGMAAYTYLLERPVVELNDYWINAHASGEMRLRLLGESDKKKLRKRALEARRRDEQDGAFFKRWDVRRSLRIAAKNKTKRIK